MGAVFATLAVKIFQFLSRHGMKATLLGVIILHRVTKYSYNAKRRVMEEKDHNTDETKLNESPMDIRRKSQIAYGKATDHTGEVILAPMKTFDLDKTIFGSITSPLTRMALKNKLAVEHYWCDHTVIRVSKAFDSVPIAPAPEQAIVDFMYTECDFAMEHADGSFADHLNFCAHYSSVHYKNCSPRVLFLHSIMGVGTNFFPMKKDKIPKLKSLLSDFEYQHIEAFPSILRLLYARDLLDELLTTPFDKLNRLEKIDFFRVIDNANLSMSAEQFWIHINLQLIHLLDFLPATSWAQANKDDSFLNNFTDVHTLLLQAKKLQANVDHDIKSAEMGSDGAPVTLGSFIQSMVPSTIKKNMSINAIKKFSKAINHSLDYTLTYRC